MVSPQAPVAPAEVQALIDATLAELRPRFECAVELHGEPRFDELSEQWFAPYSATGGECDTLAATLGTLGAQTRVAFARRPNAEELQVIVTRIVREAETPGCRISLTRAPRRAAGSTLYYASYRLHGNNCDWVTRRLRERGNEYRVMFLPADDRAPLEQFR